MDKWTSVKDNLPKVSQDVLSTDGEIVAATTYRYNPYINSYYWEYFTSGCGCCDSDMENVTHWMPRPLPPKE